MLIRNWWLPIVTFIMMIAYWPGVEAPATTIRWCILYAFLPFVRKINFEKVFTFASYGIAVNSAICIFQWFNLNIPLSSSEYNSDIRYWIVQLSVRPSGLFINGNILAETTALVIVGCIIYRKWFHILPMIPAMLLPMQRASIVALLIVGIVTLFFLVKKIYIKLYGILLLIGMSLLGLLMFRGLDIQSFHDRIEFWSFALNNLHWFGNGWGSFRNDYLNSIGYMDSSYSIIYIHNDYLELIYDLGIFGIIPIIYFGVTLFCNSRIKYVLWTFAVIACFGFPTHMPASLFILALCFIECSRNWSDNSLLLWLRGIYSFNRYVRS